MVSGTVTYLHRIMLPHGAVVSVQLVDISRQDAAPEVIYEQQILPEGRGPLYRFELDYDPAQIDERHTYAVQATIRGADGRLLFVSETPYLVLTQGRPMVVHMVLAKATEL